MTQKVREASTATTDVAVDTHDHTWRLDPPSDRMPWANSATAALSAESPGRRNASPVLLALADAAHVLVHDRRSSREAVGLGPRDREADEMAAREQLSSVRTL
jgi:hypothetical protein